MTNNTETRLGHWEQYWDNDYLSYSYRCSECKKDALAKERIEQVKNNVTNI